MSEKAQPEEVQLEESVAATQEAMAVEQKKRDLTVAARLESKEVETPEAKAAAN